MGGSNARVGHSDFLVVESDESDGSFLKLAPIVAVVTNIDREHLDHYPSLEAIQAAFIEFVNKVPFYGAVIVCLDDRQCAEHPARHQAPHHHLWHHRAGRYGGHRDRLRPLLQRLPSALSHRRSGPVPSRGPGPAQRSERHGGGGRRAGAGSEAGRDPRGAGHIQRRRPPFSDARQRARHHRGGRLRPPSHRDSRHARRRASVRIPRASTCYSSRIAIRARTI